MEFKEYCEGRWIMLIGGLFWCPVIPFAYYLAFDQITSQGIGTAIFVTVAMALLMLAAIIFLVHGIWGLIANGKKHLVLSDDSLQIIVNSGKHKGTVHNISYSDIKEFYFASKGTLKNKLTGEFYIRENAAGLIDFRANGQYYCASVYNAKAAAQFIMNKLQDEQIDSSKNELDRNGNHIIHD